MSLTCASTMAVHLEVVTDLSEDTFLQAFRRFASQKSLPKLVISDNASTFMSAAEDLRALFESSIVQEELGRKGVEWKFIQCRAPWYGGYWERFIGRRMLLRRCLAMPMLPCPACKLSFWKFLTHLNTIDL